MLSSAARHMCALVGDSTHGSNAKKMSLNFTVTHDSNNKTVMVNRALIRSECNRSYSTLYRLMLPLVYGRLVLGRVTLFILDGNGPSNDAIRSACEDGIIGKGEATFRLCIWHTVHVDFNNAIIGGFCA
jgi:hypothetical protein